MSKKNQEAFAYAVGNIVSSLFKGFPACVALSRMAILDGVGGKTQVFGLVSSSFVLIVCLAVGPLFKTLPNVQYRFQISFQVFYIVFKFVYFQACLAAIIVVALKNTILQITQLPEVLRQSKFEAVCSIFLFKKTRNDFDYFTRLKACMGCNIFECYHTRCGYWVIHWCFSNTTALYFKSSTVNRYFFRKT